MSSLLNNTENTGLINHPTASEANKKNVETHKSAAQHHQDAAKNHLEAAKYHEEGNHEKAAQSTVRAMGFTNLAIEQQLGDAKLHTIEA